jgi:hypothetical protein
VISRTRGVARRGWKLSSVVMVSRAHGGKRPFWRTPTTGTMKTQQLRARVERTARIAATSVELVKDI